MDVRERIRSQRRALGWSQRELAERADVSVRTVARLETEDREPDTATLYRVAAALGTDLGSLLDIGEGTDWLRELRAALAASPLGPQARRVSTALAQIARLDPGAAESVAISVLTQIEARRARQRSELAQQLAHRREA